MTEEMDKRAIQESLAAFAARPLAEATRNLFRSLGYSSGRDPGIETLDDLKTEFFERHEHAEQILKQAELGEWSTAALLFQLTDEDVRSVLGTTGNAFESHAWNRYELLSYLFMAVELKKQAPTRTWLAQVTRAVNRAFAMPAILVFKYGERLSLSIIDRRPGKADSGKDVLEKVTLVRDIRFKAPHRAHVEILADLGLLRLSQEGVTNFSGLHDGWRRALDQQQLNKRFYRDIANWYFWALDRVRFPKDAPENSVSLIRLITRLIFCWFIKEKGLIPEELFTEDTARRLLKDLGDQESSYYQAVLQNLFFATLNAPMNEREFLDPAARSGKAAHQHYMVSGFWRYRDQLADEALFLSLFKDIPYMNGGLFECLDHRAEDGERRVDGFSSTPKSRAHVPNELFFGARRTVDLGSQYGTGSKKEAVGGLLGILARYKFTVAENTPLEAEVALDPELLGQVFENLLASYNPETGTTARKKTGSFYTPRLVVDFMVEQALVRRWAARLADRRLAQADTEDRLKRLLSYEAEGNPFNPEETQALIQILDETKVLDPACGSGAFPMGVLHHMVLVLSKLDPGNRLWKERQLRTIENSDLGPDLKDELKASLRSSFEENDDDYGRKLYLIQKCIYGVDIQAIAVQIAKLRCFISLVVDQKINDAKPNRGVLELPNLETRFVAANTLNRVQGQIALRSDEIVDLEQELGQVRAAHFRARRYQQKQRLRDKDRELSRKLGTRLKELHLLSKEDAGNLVAWNPYDQNASAPLFDPEWMFGPEFAEPRFDVVVGNPPYVRQEKIREFKPRLEVLYKEVYTGTADLYVYFYARSLSLLAPGGVLSFISSNKYFRSGYGKKLRGHLSRNAKLDLLIDFGYAEVFEGTIAYPSILVLEKGLPKNQKLRVLPWDTSWDERQFVEKFEEANFQMDPKNLNEDGWRFENPNVHKLFKKIKNNGQALDSLISGRIFYGVKSGFDKTFIVERKKRDELIRQDSKSSKLLMPVLRGRDVKAWNASFSDYYLIRIESSENTNHPWSGKKEAEAELIFSKSFPAIFEYMRQFKTSLKKRQDQGRFYWELRSCAYWKDFQSEKIIFPDIAKRPQFCWDDKGYYFVTTVFMMPGAPKWLLGYLNSKLAFWFYIRLSAQIQGGFVRYKTQYLKALPVPKFSGDEEKQLTKLVENASSLSGSKRLEIEQEIDRVVFSGANLDEIEQALVVNGLPQVTDGKKELYSLIDRYFEDYTYLSLESIRNFDEYDALGIEESSLQRYLHTAVEEGRYFDAGRGWYSSLPEPLTLDPTPVQEVVGILKQQFPDLDVTCWSTQQLTPYMQHLMVKHFIFVSTERMGLETVGQALEEKGYTVHVNPRKTEVRRMVGGEKVVVLRPSVSREPKEGPCAQPEKVLVDLFYEAQDLNLMDGHEFSLILGNILKNKRIPGFSKLIHYLEQRADPQKAAETGFFTGSESVIAGFLKKPAKAD